MKTIEVVAAIIHNKEHYLATQRGYGEFEGMWEFPGGKVEKGETREDALKREIKEELNIEVNITRFLCTVHYSYPNFQLIMYCYCCTMVSNEIKLLEHKSAQWLKINEIKKINWLPADVIVVKKLIEDQYFIK